MPEQEAIDIGELPVIEEVPDDAFVLQSGVVVGDDGILGRFEPDEPEVEDCD